jgi:hypothetical protein
VSFLCAKCNYSDQFKEDEMVRHVARMGEKSNSCGLLVGKLERKRPLTRPRHRWVDNIKTVLREIRWDDVD